MRLLSDIISKEREFQGIITRLAEVTHHSAPHPLAISGLSEGALEAYYGAMVPVLSEKTGKPVLLILPDEKEVLKVAGILDHAGLSNLSYPFRDFQYFSVVASRDFEHERLSVLSAVLENRVSAVLTTPDAALQLTVPPARLAELTFTVRLGEEIPMERLLNQLVDGGFVRCEQTDGVGQFSCRGGILDVFPPILLSVLSFSEMKWNVWNITIR